MGSLTRFVRRLTGATVLASGVVLGSARSAAAQDVAADPRWQAWLGCWEAVESDSTPAVSTQKPLVCVIPASGTSAVEIATVVGDSIALRQRIEATGEQRQLSKDGCTGWERAQWSTNGQRVYLRSSYTCPGGLTRSSNGIMAMSAAGKWLDVQGVVAGTTVGVRVVLYRDVTGAGSLPSDIATALAGRTSRMNLDARIAAMAPLTTEDVVEASRFIDPGVVQTWLAERGEGFALDANKLIELEKAGVPSVVIDVMVALSYPRVFALDRSRVDGATRDSADESATGGRTLYLYGWDPYYSSYGSRYGYGYGYGYGLGGWYYGSRPVVIVRQPTSGDSDERAHGRVVKGRGYTPGASAPGRRGSAASKGESGSSGGAASTSTGSGSSSKSPSSGSGRTAKPRPPQ